MSLSVLTQKMRAPIFFQIGSFSSPRKRDLFRVIFQWMFLIKANGRVKIIKTSELLNVVIGKNGKGNSKLVDMG